MSVIPPVIEKIMESGWSTHFSLALVDPAFLKQADAAQYAKIVIGLASSSKTADRLAIANTPARVKAEENMSFDEWRFAFDNLMLLIEKYRDPDSITTWQNHWYMVFSHRDVREKWPRLMKYDTKIRQMATQFNFDMGIWQHRIYDKIVDQDQEDIAACRFTGPTHPSANPHASFTKHSGEGSTVPKRNKPTQPARGNDFREWCFRCGLHNDHQTKCFTATKQTNGQPFVIQCTGNGRSIGNTLFCFAFNTLKGCTSSPCSNPPHGASVPALTHDGS
ncbi:hypothetical protein FRC10_003336 [Ceratobasidium sp. 414]|nr:hypothetical protein FRC10_003336 [Ceratobasidium sp. 414]